MGLKIFFSLSLIFVLLIPLFRNRTMTKAITIIYALLHIAFTLYCWANPGKTELAYFTFDSKGIILLSVLSVLSLPTVYHGFKYTSGDDTKRFNLYHIALIFLIAFMSGAYIANGMTVLWIFVEATTLAVAALIYHDRGEMALEATWKYVFVCSTGIAIAYLGILFLGFIYGRGDAANLSFESLADIISRADPMYLKIAFLFVLVGFSTKMGLFPMHTVTIDAHSVAPPPVSALISTTLMNVGFLAIFRVYSLFSSTAILNFMNNVLMLSGVLSIIVAAGYMLKAKHLKRMLAYSSLEIMGLVAIATGTGNRYGYFAALLLIVMHSLVKSGLFYHMGQLSRVLRTFKLDDSGRYLKLNPAGAMVLITGMICILAIPPSGMFIAEFRIFQGLISSGKIIIMLIVAMLLCFIVYAMSVRIMHVLFSEPKDGTLAPEAEKISSAETVTQFFFFGLVIIMCFYQPPFLVDIINQAIAILPE